MAQLAQVLAVEELGDEARQSVTRAHDIDDFDDVLTRHGGDGLGLALETRGGFRVLAHRLVQDLYGESLRKPDVLSCVHASHTAGAEKLRNAERTGQHFADE